MPEDSISLIHGIIDNICYIFFPLQEVYLYRNFHFGHSGTIVQCEPVYLCSRNAFTYFLTYLPMIYDLWMTWVNPPGQLSLPSLWGR